MATINTPSVRAGGPRASEKAKPFAINVTTSDASTAEEIKAAVTASEHYITHLMISCKTATTITINAGASALLGPFMSVTSAPLVCDIHFKNPIPVGESTAINLKAADAGVVSVVLEGFTEQVHQYGG